MRRSSGSNPLRSPTATPVTMTTAQMIAACLPRIKYRFSFFSNSRLSMASRQTLRVRMCTNTQSSESQNTLPVNPHTHTHTHTRANTHTHSILTLPFASKRENSCVWIPNVWTYAPLKQSSLWEAQRLKKELSFPTVQKIALITVRSRPTGCHNVYAGRWSLSCSVASPHSPNLMLTAVIHGGQGLNLYRPSVKHKSKYVKSAVKEEWSQTSIRERERRGGGRHRKAEYKWKELLRGEEGLMGRRDLG